MKVHNFSAGPSILPESVIQEAAKAVIELENTGLSLLEISHRSSYFINIIEKAKALTKELLNISEEYEVLFLQGGASLQFYMSALNFATAKGKSGYIDTGTWSSKAIKESEKMTQLQAAGETLIVASSKDKNYNYIPKNITINQPLDYLHFTSNNTIYGTQFHSFKNVTESIQDAASTYLICDMSSDIFSKKINVNDFDLIYAGAQKNLGPAGATLIIVRKDLFRKNPHNTNLNSRNHKHLPTYLNYSTHIEKESMFNTPPVFSIYVCMLTLKWLKKLGGISVIEERNKKKAEIIYSEIDRNSLFEGYTNKNDRSNMNATFILKKEELIDQFNKLCNDAQINGIHGHRSVGGYRASMYNALDVESVNTLVEVMKTLEKKA